MKNRNTRRQQALELYGRISRGPSFLKELPDLNSHSLGKFDKPVEGYQLWAKSWVLPFLVKLIPELEHLKDQTEDVAKVPSTTDGTDVTTPPKPSIGFYSVKAATEFGSLIYLSPDGQEVEVTAVYDNQESGQQEYYWADKKCVGPVTKCLKTGKVGRSERDTQ
jgi:hypothetical protein